MKEKQIAYNNETKTIKEWAEFLGVAYATLNHHVRNIGGIAAIKRFHQPKGIINPETRETRTVAEWAMLVGITSNSFRLRLKTWGIDDPRTFLDQEGLLKYSEGEQSGNLRLQIAKRNNQRLCRNPDTGEEKVACDWAKYYGVPLIEFYQAMKQYGKDSFQLYQHFEKRRNVA